MLRRRAGFGTLQVSFAGKAATLCLLYAFPLLFLGDHPGWGGALARVLGWAFAVWGTAADPRARNVGGFAIGLTVAADILAIGPITSASMNPARSFGPTLVAYRPELWQYHWIYWVGPLVGAGIAAITYHLVLWPRDTSRGVDPGATDVPKSLQP